MKAYADNQSPRASTIAAIASPPGPAARGVIRISGPETAGIIAACCRAADAPMELDARGAYAGTLDDGRGEQPASVLWMPGPRSFTREDVAELHLCGSPFLLAAALDAVLRAGARMATPGEFTRRAFENGRIDLTRAEGVLALVSARSAEERRAATALLLGGLDERLAKLRDGLDASRALCEASLDFDEDDTGHIPTAELAAGARKILEGLTEASKWEERRAPDMGQPRIVLAGAPNSGKSALFNHLAENAQAIVSDHAGTTRDSIAGNWCVRGVDCRLVDTAGLDEGQLGPADSGAQRTSERELRSADLILWVVDGARFVDAASLTVDTVKREFESSAAARLAAPTPRLCLWNKSDHEGVQAPTAAQLNAARGVGNAGGEFLECMPLSALTECGLDEIAAAVARALGLTAATRDSAADPAASTRAPSGLGRELSARHRHALGEALEELAQALAALEAGLPLDLFAECLRQATDALDRITGRTTPEDLLDRIFAQFCLGK